jgi:hypothetical protein
VVFPHDTLTERGEERQVRGREEEGRVSEPEKAGSLNGEQAECRIS